MKRSPKCGSTKYQILTLKSLYSIFFFTYRYTVMESEVAVDGTVTATGHRLLSVDLDTTTRDALLQQGTYVHACDLCTCIHNHTVITHICKRVHDLILKKFFLIYKSMELAADVKYDSNSLDYLFPHMLFMITYLFMRLFSYPLICMPCYSCCLCYCENRRLHKQQ